MRFIVDAQLPPIMAKRLSARGFTAEHVADIIIWLRIGNTSRRALLEWFEPMIPQIVQLIEQGERLIEVR